MSKCEPKLFGCVTCLRAFTQATHSSRQRAIKKGERRGGERGEKRERRGRGRRGREEEGGEERNEREGRKGREGEEREGGGGKRREDNVLYREGRMSERRRGCKTMREFCFIQCEYTFLSSDSDSGSAK